MAIHKERIQPHSFVVTAPWWLDLEKELLAGIKLNLVKKTIILTIEEPVGSNVIEKIKELIDQEPPNWISNTLVISPVDAKGKDVYSLQLNRLTLEDHTVVYDYNISLTTLKHKLEFKFVDWHKN